ncbi:MAG: winged helix-turn-helix transcriptional regulator [Candidatus Nanohaloarchaea archaeon]
MFIQIRENSTPNVKTDKTEEETGKYIKSTTISKTSMKILKQIKENPGITQAEIAENLEVSYTVVSRNFNSDYGTEYLRNMTEKQRGEDGRRKEIYIKEDKQQQAETIIKALNIINKNS